MATIFPGSASVGQIFDGYEFNGTAWDIIGIDLTADYLETSAASAIYLNKVSASNTYQTIVANVSNTEIGYLDGVTSAIQTQLDNKSTASKTETLTNKTLTTPTINGPAITAIGQTPTIHGIYLPAPHNIIFEGTTANEFETTLEPGEPTADRTITLPDQTGTVQLRVVDVSDTEIGYLNGVTSDIQTQIDSKLSASSASTIYATQTALNNIDALPSQSGNSGKYLTTSGSVASWGTIDLTSAINTASAAAVTYLVDSAPAALDTLNELAAALGDDANYASTITTALGTKAPLASPTFTGSVTTGEAITKTTSTTLTSASTTYLTQASASTTYLTQALASNTYQNKNIDIITKSEAYEIASGDENDLIQLSGSNAYTVSIPTDASANFTIGTQINLLNIGTGVKTVAAVTPGTTTVNGTPGLKLRTQWSSATLIKRAANTWVLIGDLAE
jgi:hypothetical protein